MDKIDLAWSGGLFEGEGDFSLLRRRKGKYPYSPCRYDSNVQMSMTDREPLERVLRTLGGKLYGPYHRKPIHKPVWVWSVPRKEQTRVATMLMPFLESSKRRRAEILIEARQIMEQHAKDHRQGSHNKGFHIPWPPKMEELVTEMRRLNKRGV